MNTGYPSYASSPWADSSDDFSPDSGFNSMYSSTFGSTRSQLGSSQDVEIHSSSQFGQFIHGKSPSWPVTQAIVKPCSGHPFPNNRSTSWSGQTKTEDDSRYNLTKSFSNVAGERYREKALDTTCPENTTGHGLRDVVARATHREEILSPESARRIFREATARNERLKSDRNSSSLLNSTPEKTQMKFLEQSPSAVDKNYAASRASDHSYEDFMGRSVSSPQKGLNDLASCRRITLPRESVSRYETLKRPHSILMPYGNEVDTLPVGGFVGQSDSRSQACYKTSSQSDWQNSNTSHKISGSSFNHDASSGLYGRRDDTVSVRDLNHRSCDNLKLVPPVQVQNQRNDWNQLQERSGHPLDAGPHAAQRGQNDPSPHGLVVAQRGQNDASPHGLVVGQRGQNDALIPTLPRSNESACPTVMVSESLLKTNDPNSAGELHSQNTLCSESLVLQQIERLSLSRTSMLRKLSQEFYGPSVKHSPGEANHASLGTKSYRRFGSVDEVNLPPADNSKFSPVSYSKPVGNTCLPEEDSRNQLVKPGENGNGVIPSGGPLGFKAVGVTNTAGSPIPRCHFPTSPGKTIETMAGQDVESSFRRGTCFHEPKPEKSCEKVSLPVSLDDQNTAVALVRDSPPPPDLPPRKYRERDGVREKLISASVHSQRLDLFSTNDDDNFDSPATADNYAEQLRQQAKRWSHSHGSVFSSIHSPKMEQVALPGGHFRNLADRINQESKNSPAPGFTLASIHSPRVQQMLPYSGTLPNVSQFEKLPNDKHFAAVPSNSYDACRGSSAASDVNESSLVGNIRVPYSLEEVTAGKTDNIRVSIEGRKCSDPEQKRVSYLRSISSLESTGLGHSINGSKFKEKNFSMERKTCKEKSSCDKTTHLCRERNNSALEAANLSNKKSNSGDESKFSNQKMKTSSHKEKSTSQERNSASQERNSASQERNSASQERNSAGQERKALTCSGNRPCHTDHGSIPGWKNLSQERDGKSYQRNHSNEEKQVLNQERKNSSSEDRKSHGSDKSVHSSQERSLSHERKSISCEKRSIVERRTDLKHELHAGKSGNEITSTLQAGKPKSPENDSSCNKTKWCSSHKISGHENTILNSSSSDVALVDSAKAKDVTQEQKIKNSGSDRKICNLTSKKLTVSDCEAHLHELEVDRKGVELKCKATCDEYVKKFKNNVDKSEVPSHSKGDVLNTSSRLNSSGLHSQKSSNKEGNCKMVNSWSGSEPHQEPHLKVETLPVKATETNSLDPTNCEANGAMTKPLNSISRTVSVTETRKTKPGKPILGCDSESEMQNTKPVHSSFEADSVVTREKQAKLFIMNDSHLKPVSPIFPNESAIEVTLDKRVASILDSKCDLALEKIQGSLYPSSLNVEVEIPGFLSDILPTECKTSTYYLSQLALNRMFSKTEESGPCSLPAVRITIQPYLRYLVEKAMTSSSTFEKHGSTSVYSNLKPEPVEDKLSVLHKIEDKLKEFELEKQSIEKDVMENAALGLKMTSLSEQKLEPKEFGKYKLYVDEVDKVLCLLLNITKRLAGVENSIKSLPNDGSSSEMPTLISKRNDLSQKYEDARALSEGIAGRRHHVSDCLIRRLSDEEFNSFEQFIVAKLRLFVERQAVEDMVAILDGRLQLLHSDYGVSSN